MQILEQKIIDGLAEIFVDGLKGEDKTVMLYGMIPQGAFETFYSVVWNELQERKALPLDNPETNRYKQDTKTALARAVVKAGAFIG